MTPQAKTRFGTRTHLTRPLTAEYQHYRMQLNDVSLTGAFLEEDLLLPVGQPLPLTVWLDEHHAIQVEAIVRRAAEGHRGHGVEFVGMSAEAADRLREFLRAARHSPVAH